jgi:signal transduction histidine kinase
MEVPEQQMGVLGGSSLVAAAHELKAPLALIRQLSLGLETGECDAASVAQLARRITLTSERALRLTTDLTKSVRLEDSLFTIEPVNPVRLCEEVVQEIAPLYAARGRRIEVAPRQRPLLALANKDLLRRVLLGFADNALQYCDGDEPVLLRARQYSGRVRLSVRDFGPAVPVKLWQSLGASLGKSPQPIHNRPASSGLGMYIAGQFAEAMQGRVGATRHRDGASFYIDLTPSTQLRLL